MRYLRIIPLAVAAVSLPIYMAQAAQPEAQKGWGSAILNHQAGIEAALKKIVGPENKDLVKSRIESWTRALAEYDSLSAELQAKHPVRLIVEQLNGRDVTLKSLKNAGEAKGRYEVRASLLGVYVIASEEVVGEAVLEVKDALEGPDLDPYEKAKLAEKIRGTIKRYQLYLDESQKKRLNAAYLKIRGPERSSMRKLRGRLGHIAASGGMPGWRH